ncbi:hypothetical protein CC2G_012379 [Coprinopsis cinerea AmutBmut pab1-1]|nr:hypothetical protein CC2G_012379 [Coprinopsis cinerea AmutBmut pab1-1]
MSTKLPLSFLLIGSYLNISLLVLESVMLVSYFCSEKSQHDSKWLKYLIAFLYVMDLLGSVAACAVVFLFSYAFWGEYEADIHWPLELSVITTGINAFAVQSYMVRRYWNFSRNRYMTTLLESLALASFCGVVVTAVLNFIWGVEEQRESGLRFALVGLSLAVATDCLITASLIHKLRRMPVYVDETKSLINRIIVLAIQTGSAPALLALTGLITFAVLPGDLISLSFSMSLGSVYVCTMLYTLNRRESLRRLARGGEPSWIHLDHLPPDSPSISPTGATSGRSREGDPSDGPGRTSALSRIWRTTLRNPKLSSTSSGKSASLATEDGEQIKVRDTRGRSTSLLSRTGGR